MRPNATRRARRAGEAVPRRAPRAHGGSSSGRGPPRRGRSRSRAPRRPGLPWAHARRTPNPSIASTRSSCRASPPETVALVAIGSETASGNSSWSAVRSARSACTRSTTGISATMSQYIASVPRTSEPRMSFRRRRRRHVEIFRAGRRRAAPRRRGRCLDGPGPPHTSPSRPRSSARSPRPGAGRTSCRSQPKHRVPCRLGQPLLVRRVEADAEEQARDPPQLVVAAQHPARPPPGDGSSTESRSGASAHLPLSRPRRGVP